MASGESQGASGSERRRHPRCKVAAQLELHPPGAAVPIRTATSEMSIGGCYVETMFTFAVGTTLAMTLWLDGEKVATTGRVATCFPQVGNGIEFADLGDENRKRLERFLAEHANDEGGA